MAETQMEIRPVVVLVMLFLAAASGAAPVLDATDDLGYLSLLDQLDADEAWSVVDHLASDSFEGRRAGTLTADLASEYIAGYFASIRLEPAGQTGTYRTKFAIPLWQLVQLPNLALLDAGGNTLLDFKYRKDFNVIPGSGEGDYSAEVVFAGYGISANNIGYDDYADISARAKIVLAIVGAPPSDRFRDGDYEASYVKAENAFRHGAAGLILIDSPADPTPHYVERTRCGCCWRIYEGLTILGGAVGLAEALLKDSGLTLDSVQRTINRDLKPQSFDLRKRLHVSVAVSFTENPNAYNVLGFIPGSDPGASRKTVIIGAHYDHWGKDVDGSIFRGANDDASGIAVMMEIARIFSADVRPKSSVLFTAWSGEEEGFYGSYAYVNHPYFPLGETIAYLNLDMVGYGQQLSAHASEAHKTLRDVVSESAEMLGMPLSVQGYTGGSDQVPFEQKGVQNVILIYWPDDLYHTPADTASHVSRRNLIETARLTALIALRLSKATVARRLLTATEGTAPVSRTSTPKTEYETGTFWKIITQSTVEIALGLASAIVIVAAAFYFQRRKR